MKKKWSRQFDKCQACGTTERKHYARGVCQRCYMRLPHMKQFNMDWKKTHRGRVLSIKKKYYYKNRDKYLAYKKEWYQKKKLQAETRCARVSIGNTVDDKCLNPET